MHQIVKGGKNILWHKWFTVYSNLNLHDCCTNKIVLTIFFACSEHNPTIKDHFGYT